MFLLNHNIDILLISETHFTTKNFFRIPNYITYTTNHPAGTARGGTAIIIKCTIQHNPLNPFTQDYLQATSIALEGPNGLITISAVYLPPKYTITHDHLTSFYTSLGHKFLAGGDYNAKHTDWGSRLISPRGRTIQNFIERFHYNHHSSGEPTYWPTDRNKLPDLVDFCISKGIPHNSIAAKSCLELSSDHTPVLITLSFNISLRTPHPSLCNNKTNWELFHLLFTEHLDLHVPLKTPSDIEAAINSFNNLIQWAGWSSTPESPIVHQTSNCPLIIKQKILHKRSLRRIWHATHSRTVKRQLNKATYELKQLLSNNFNESFQHYIQNLSPTASSNYSIWKAVKKNKHITTPSPPLLTPQGTWASTNSTKAHTFANHLASVFQPHPSNNLPEEENSIINYLESPYQLDPPLPRFKQSEVKTIIKTLYPKTSPGYDLITGKILQELPPAGIKYITQLINSSILIGYFPDQWKVAQIILLLKPGKPPHVPASYRPISLLPLLSKVFEKLLFQRLLPIVENQLLLPDHQFGFRQRHSTIQQTHRIVNKIHEALETKQYCSAAFLDISQAFDKVWHTGLLFKLRRSLPLNYFLLVKSYLQNRHYRVKVDNAYTDLLPIRAGVPQGSVLGPLLYLLYTSDLPSSSDVTTATFADDTAVLAIDPDPTNASQKLQSSLNDIQDWLSLWRLKANGSKSTHITFSNRRGNCPTVYIYNDPLPQAEVVKYLGLHLDKRLTWHHHIFTKRKQLGITISKLYWLLGRKSKLNLNNKLLIYKASIKPIWTYGIQLWGTASTSNIEILECFQSKVLRLITDAPWYVPNAVLRKDLQVPSIKEEIRRFSSRYREGLSTHPNRLATQLMKPPTSRRLKKNLPSDLPSRFSD
ncbi:RNA-directed DNA polymerase from mobile element jockey [Cryptotermes secundus]|uniref:RNA-directed DNA polymerase from mobile element jockey n=1 Tax=Cryptotermes secundus TaxID=105785 RepID=A0A2J7PVX3_9NEOP|nr:RNA-directed DNA polymerase from mobile element jockey [Cryptotermes secundus]PNF20481.1 RNA-directed DNA polymerase from mobile element jockey [Cryptotermes secundus]